MLDANRQLRAEVRDTEIFCYAYFPFHFNILFLFLISTAVHWRVLRVCLFTQEKYVAERQCGENGQEQAQSHHHLTTILHYQGHFITIIPACTIMTLSLE